MEKNWGLNKYLRSRIYSFLSTWSERFQYLSLELAKDAQTFLDVEQRPKEVKIIARTAKIEKLAHYNIELIGPMLVVQGKGVAVLLHSIDRTVEVQGASVLLESRVRVGEVWKIIGETTDLTDIRIPRNISSPSDVSGKFSIDPDPILGGRKIQYKGLIVHVNYNERRVVVIDATVKAKVKGKIRTWGYRYANPTDWNPIEQETSMADDKLIVTENTRSMH